MVCSPLALRVPQAWHPQQPFCRALPKSSHHLRSNVTSAPAAGTFPSEVLSRFFPSRAIPSLPLPADGITRALYPPEPRCNWIGAPALPARSLPSFSQTPPVERSCLWSTALPRMELTPCSQKGFSNQGVICAHNKMNKTPNPSWFFGGEWLVQRLSS